MWNKIWEKHSGKCVGISAGLFFGFIYLFCGLWDMLVFALLVYIGYYVGKKKDEQISIFEMILDWIQHRLRNRYW